MTVSPWPGTEPGFAAKATADQQTLLATSVQTSASSPRHSLVAAVAIIAMTGSGYSMAVLNGALVRMRGALSLTTGQVATLAGTAPICFMLGVLLGGMGADRFGHKRAIGACCLLLTAGSLGMAASSCVPLLVAFRGLLGAGMGASVVTFSIYLAEIAPRRLRGQVTALIDAALNLGMLLAYSSSWALLGMPLDWQLMIGLGGLPPLLVVPLLCLPQLPESPRWLFAKGKTVEAGHVLLDLVGEAEATESLALMVAERSERLAPQSAIPALSPQKQEEEVQNWGDLFSCLLVDRPVRRMFAAGIAVAVAQNGSGFQAMIYFSSSVLSHNMGQQRAFLATLIMGVIKLAVNLLVLAVLEHMGRRPMLILSSILTAGASFILAVMFALDAAPLIQAAGFLAYMAFFSLGLGPVTLVYLPEVFPTKWRSKGTSVALLVGRLLGVATVVSFPLVFEHQGAPAAFGLQFVIAGTTAVGIWLLAHETGGYALEDAATACGCDQEAQQLSSKMVC